jgi:hypothetical protein
VLLTCILLLASCSSAPSADAVGTSVAATIAAQSAQQGQVSSSVATQAVNTTAPTTPTKPTATKMPTATLQPTTTLLPSPTPLATYSGPLVIAEFSGTGAIVTEDFLLPKCYKAVFYWTVEKDEYWTSLTIQQHNKDTGSDKEILSPYVSTNDVTAEVLSGSGLSPLLGGNYYFSSEASGDWTMRIECHDADAPIAEGMNVQGVSGMVTDNYVLTACEKSIFNWSAAPLADGTASLNLYLCSMSECNDLVSDGGSDLTAPITGQALQKVNSGEYFLYSELGSFGNPNHSWSVTWECKD